MSRVWSWRDGLKHRALLLAWAILSAASAYRAAAQDPPDCVDAALAPIECGEPLPSCRGNKGHCTQLLLSNGRTLTDSTVNHALSCLEGNTAFITDAHNRISTGTPYREALPNRYEPPAEIEDPRLAYSEAQVSNVVRWAQARIEEHRSDECAAEQILLEAAFRKASAHGMFGDDRLLRGLNPEFLRQVSTFSNDPLAPGLLLLDSRACKNPENIAGSTLELCNTDADCEPTEVCAACKYTATFACSFDEDHSNVAVGPYGAIQEYRRAENALVQAADLLGEEKFRQLDALTGCRGGCSSALLLRLGANKIRAQALRLDLLESRAAALGWPPGRASCQNDSANSSAACSLDGDCGPMGRCGAPGSPERAYVMLRQAADEAFAESGAAYSVYNKLLDPRILVVSNDDDLQAARLSAMNEVINRSVSGLTPFGMPADYVPYLALSQMQGFNCFDPHAECSTERSVAGDAGSVVSCIDDLLNGNASIESLLQQAEAAQLLTDTALDKMSEGMKAAATMEVDFRSQIRATGQDMLGAPCQSDCGCASDDFAGGRCVRIDIPNGDGAVIWQVQGRKCSDPAADICDAPLVDGRLEQALQGIQRDRFNLIAIDRDIGDLAEKIDQTKEKYAQLQSINASKCSDLREVIQESGNALADLRRETKTSADEIAEAAGLAAGIAALNAGPDAPLGISVGAKSGLLAAAAGKQVELEHRIANRRIELEAQMVEVQTNKEDRMTAITCAADSQVLSVQEADALFDLAQTQGRLETNRLQQELTIYAAISEMLRLGVELKTRISAIRETAAVQQIWGPESDFSNPINYRLLAIDAQLEARSKFREAQRAVWILLRAIAYDFVESDFVFAGGQRPNTFSIPNCAGNTCTQTGGSCINACPPAPEGRPPNRCAPPLPVYDNGSSTAPPGCSLRSVLAARTVADLRALRESALFEKKYEALGEFVCGGNVCEKRLSLKRIFTDAFADGEQGRRTLGEILAENSAPGEFTSHLDFAILLDRDFQVCPIVGPDSKRQCMSLGLAGLQHDDESFNGIAYGSGPLGEFAGRLAENIWAQKLFGIKGYVTFNNFPGVELCRNQIGSVVAPTAFTKPQCDLACPHGDVCNLFPIGTNSVLASLTQKEPGLVRTRNAVRFTGGESIDQFAAFKIRTGALDASGSDLADLVIPDIILPSTETDANIKCVGRGAPVASPRWQLEVTANVNSAAHKRAFFESIEDIVLIIKFQARSL